MKILHCCLACFYVDDYGYQENILPKEHQKAGHEVEIVASTETFLDRMKLGYTGPGFYMSRSGIPVTRLPYSRALPHAVMKKIRVYKGLPELLNRFQPDVVFVHDCQFVDIWRVARYVRRNPHVKVFVDCHTDFHNSARNWFSKNVMHRLVYRWCAQAIDPYVTKFYGVLPLRCDFLHEVYGIARQKIELLELGGEDEKIDAVDRNAVRMRICEELGLDVDDFIVVSGGKLDAQKNVVALVTAVLEHPNERVKLVLFGSMSEDVREVVEPVSQTAKVKYAGWLESDRIYEYLLMADLAVFPGSHSVIWEQAVACGVPCVFRRIEGMQHVDTGGNCVLLDRVGVGNISNALSAICDDQRQHQAMQRAASAGAERFRYSVIARRALNGG